MSLLGRKLRRDGRRQWLQLGGVAVTLALGVAVFGAAFDAYDNLETSYAEVYQRLDFADLTVTGGETDRLAEEVRSLDGVAAVTTRDQADVPVRVRTGEGDQALLGRIVGHPRRPAVNRLLVEEGRRPSAGDAAVTVERHMADHFGLGAGDRVEVFGPDGWQRLEVAGVAVSPEYLWPARSRQDLLTSADDFGVLFAAPALVDRLGGDAVEHQVLVRYASGADRSAVEERVRASAAAVGAGDVMPRSDQPSNAALQEDVDAFGQLAVLFPLLFLAAGALATYVLLGRLVRSQRAQLGMLFANGYPRRRILRHYLAFGVAVGAGGAAAGALGGLGLARLLTDAYTSALGIPLAVTRFHPATPLVGLAVGTLTGVAAAAGPALSATRVPPAEAMQGVSPVGVASRRLVERVPGLRGLPVRVRMVVRNGVRSPRRSLSTGVGVVLAAVLVLSSLGILDTVELVVDEQFGAIQREDAQLYLEPEPEPEPEPGAEPGPEGAVAAARRIPGVAAAEPSLQASVVVTAGDARYQTRLQGFEPGTAMHGFPDGLPASGVVVGRALQDILAVEPGDTVRVATGESEPVAVEVAGFVDEPLGSLAYASLDQARRLVGDAGNRSVLVRYESGVDPGARSDRLAEVPGVVAVRDVRAIEEAVTRMLELFYVIFGVMLLFGSILAFVVLFNALSVNLSERTVELATMRAAGARLPTVARLITGENLVLVVASIPVGLLAGWAVAHWLMGSFDSDLWDLSLRLRGATPLLVAAALAVTALATHLPARRSVRRLDVATIVRERAL